MDFLWTEGGARWGIQRKTPSDLLSSVADGRLGKELGQSEALDHVVLVLEGEFKYDMAGRVLLGRRRAPGGWTEARVRGLLLDIQNRGWRLVQTRDWDTTLQAVDHIHRRSSKPDRDSIPNRPSLRRGEWGTDQSSREWGIHVLQSVHGVGRAVAGAIIDHFGGLPTRLTVTREELERVNGVGPKTAKAIDLAFNGINPSLGDAGVSGSDDGQLD